MSCTTIENISFMFPALSNRNHTIDQFEIREGSSSDIDLPWLVFKFQLNLIQLCIETREIEYYCSREVMSQKTTPVPLPTYYNNSNQFKSWFPIENLLKS